MAKELAFQELRRHGATVDDQEGLFAAAAAAIAGARLVTFDTGHFMMAEDPDRFRTVLRTFLQSLPAAH